MLIKRLDGKRESAEESSNEYKNTIEGNERQEIFPEIAFLPLAFLQLINK